MRVYKSGTAAGAPSVSLEQLNHCFSSKGQPTSVQIHWVWTNNTLISTCSDLIASRGELHLHSPICTSYVFVGGQQVQFVQKYVYRGVDYFELAEAGGFVSSTH
jgi:hypothetical protein